ncbi:MAG: DUF559 domain-containing protein [Nitrosarchaeum sp.]|nr:DUF559 domain-containing protein [Nitrosarchaeum sp.]
MNANYENRMMSNGTLKVSHEKGHKTGFDNKYICKKCNKSFNSGNLKRHTCLINNDDDIKQVYDLYMSGLSSRDILAKGFSGQLIKIALRGRRRTLSQSLSLHHKQHPCSNELRQKFRDLRLKYMNEHKGIPRWRESHAIMSYPEKIFADIIKRNKLTEKYDIIREYCIFPYYADFAFLNIQLDVEVDGSQHWRSENRKANDRKRDSILVQQGWRLYRIPEFRLKNEFEKVELEFLDYLKNIELQPKQLGFDNDIIEYEKIKLIRQQNKIQMKQQKQQQQEMEKINARKSLIDTVSQSNIDFSSFGWVAKVAKLINKRPQKINKWMKKYMHDFYENNCFKSGCDLVKQQLRTNKILESQNNIDYSSFGWVTRAADIIEISPQKICGWMKKYMPDFYRDKCFKKRNKIT